MRHSAAFLPSLHSLHSTEFRSIMRRAAVPVIRLEWYWHMDRMSVTIERTNSDVFRLVFKCVHPDDHFDPEHHLMLTFDGTPLFITASSDSLLIVHKTPKPEEDVVQRLCDFLFDAFPTRDTYALIGKGQVPVLHSLLHRFLTCDITSTRSCVQFFSIRNNLKAEPLDVAWLCPVGCSNLMTVPLTSQHIRIYEAKWLHFDSLLDMECVHLDVVCARFTSQQMHIFIRNWLRGDFPKLKWLLVDLNDEWLNFYHFDLEEIIDGVEAVKLEDYEIGIEIRRNDGVKAMVAVTENTFEFSVNSK